MYRQVKRINLLYKLKRALVPTKTRIMSFLLFCFGVFLIPLGSLNFFVTKSAEEKIFNFSEIENIPDVRVGIVYGSSLNNKGNEPGGILKDRLDTALELYKKGKVNKLILSGYKLEGDYDEPGIMYSYLVEKGIPEFDLKQDTKGVDTYTTCLRAKEIFGVSKAILITQKFHLARTIYLCENFGIESYGVASDKSVYENLFYNRIREFFALGKAYMEINIIPVKLEPEEKQVI